MAAIDMEDHSNASAASGEDADRGQVVHLGNAGELADQIVRRTRCRWILPWALFATVLLTVVVLQVAHGYREREDQASAEASEIQARITSEPITGDGYQVTQIHCRIGDDSATYSGRITNTGNAPRDYSLTVKFLDADGVEIGESGRSVGNLASKSAANVRLSGTLVRFAGGAPLKRCVFGVEPGQPGCPDLLIAGAKISDDAWSRGCTGDDRKLVLTLSRPCRDGRKLWVSPLGFAYSGEPFQTGDVGAEESRCVTGA